MTKGYKKRKKVQEKDEKSSHQRKLNYKKTKAVMRYYCLFVPHIMGASLHSKKDVP